MDILATVAIGVVGWLFVLAFSHPEAFYRLDNALFARLILGSALLAMFGAGLLVGRQFSWSSLLIAPIWSGAVVMAGLFAAMQFFHWLRSADDEDDRPD